MPPHRTVKSDSRGIWIKVNGVIYRPTEVTKITVGDLVFFFEKNIGCSVRKIRSEENEIWKRPNEMNDLEKIGKLKFMLSDIRIKHGVDYAILHKYGKTRVMCARVWRQSIEEIVAKLELEIYDWHIYN